MSERDKSVKFRNYARKIKLPFKISADAEQTNIKSILLAVMAINCMC